MKENQLLLKDLLEPWRIKFILIYDCNIAKYVHWQGLFQPLF